MTEERHEAGDSEQRPEGPEERHTARRAEE
jgi:hypothetical protein